MCINTHTYVTGISIKYIHLVVILIICEIVHFEITSGHNFSQLLFESLT